MIGIDTSVPPRLLAAENARPHRPALDSLRPGPIDGLAFASAATVAETIRVLEAADGFSDDEILEVLLKLLKIDDLALDDAGTIRAADQARKPALRDVAARPRRQAGRMHTIHLDRCAAAAVSSVGLTA